MLSHIAMILVTVLTLNQTSPVDVTFRVTVPADTPADAGIFIAGDFQGWNPGSPAHRLTRVSDHIYEITLALELNATIEYKFTRGDWSTVEKGRRGEEISNRKLTVAATAVVEHAVANWRDLSTENAPPRQPTITGDVTLIDVPGFLGGRRVWVYLPPGYHGGDERYPVLYMLDGQNVFDESTSFAGEWKADETCERLIAAGAIEPIIVVAVANAELRRSDEYTPWYDPSYQGGGGGAADAFLDAMSGVLVPTIDTTYRTQSGPASTGLAGSSLGGLIALYAAYEYPHTFGLIGAFSPYLGWKDDEMLRWSAGRDPVPVRVYMDMGTREWGSMRDADNNGVDDAIDDLRVMRRVMLGQGFVEGEDLLVVEDEGARHHETAWATRLPGALRFLFPR
jgi:pullulanase